MNDEMVDKYIADRLYWQLRQITNSEDGLEGKHEMLTAIGLATTNKHIFKMCEEIRNELPDCPSQIQIERDVLLRDSDKVQFCTDDNSRLSEHDESNGDL